MKPQTSVRNFDTGKIVDVKIFQRIIESQHEYLHEGYTLLRLAGVPYSINRKRRTKALCAICTKIIPGESECCVGCVAAVPTFEKNEEI